MLKSMFVFFAAIGLAGIPSARAGDAVAGIAYGSKITVQGVIATGPGDVLMITLDHPITITPGISEGRNVKIREDSMLEVGALMMRVPVGQKPARLTGTLSYMPMKGNGGHDAMIMVEQVQWL